jgi:precorrin-2 dehydrogenase / sirohydrochlorin ferrochelatase
MAAQGLIRFRREDFIPEHLDGMSLAIAATNDFNTNSGVSTAAQARGLLVNIVDQPDLCSFVVPATIRRGELTLAISTGGRSPALAKKMRRDLEKVYGPEYGPYVELLGAIREKVLSCRRDHPENLSLFTRIVTSPLLEFINSGNQEGLQALLAQMLTSVLPAPDLQDLQTFAASLCRTIQSFKTISAG